MGRFQGRAARKLPSLVSMTWSGYPKGQERPLVDGGGREGSLVRDGTAIRSDGSGWGQFPDRARAGGMQRERAAGSLAKIAV